MTAKTLMIQGTTSHAGKSLFVTALCKHYSQDGYRVAPFKAQNMSLNSFATKDGKEIGRAQALQAFAAGIEPITDMNPILLKPKGNGLSQIVFHGKPYADISFKNYHHIFALKEGIRGVQEALARLKATYDLVLIEGAGSPAEINLYEVEIVNMRIAEIANSPVILIADIDRGGVFASIIGTLTLLKPHHQDLVQGIIINKFRGDPSILEPGIHQIEELTGKPVLGVLPYIEILQLPDEDSLSLDKFTSQNPAQLQIAVIRFPKISNFTDFDPLNAEPGVNIYYVTSNNNLGAPDVVILPGTKNTVQDLIWLKHSGLAEQIETLAQREVPIIGICGGYQMLGNAIIDTKGIEGGIQGAIEGLGLLDVTTHFDAYTKETTQTSAQVIGYGPILKRVKEQPFSGYEIHMGTSILGKNVIPAFRISRTVGAHIDRLDGAISKKGLIFGTYLHGLFDDAPVRNALIRYLMERKSIKNLNFLEQDIKTVWNRELNRLVGIVESNVDMTAIRAMIDLSEP